jgi:hypothetical protein
MFWLMPPSLEAFCLNQSKGVSNAHDQQGFWYFQVESHGCVTSHVCRAADVATVISV